MIIQIAPAIKRLSLTRVGCWKNVIIDFIPLLNILQGERGCGKSTILRSILHAVQPLHPDRFPLTPTYPSTSGTIGIEFNRESVVLDIPALAGIPKKPDVNESCGQFMLSQLRSHIAGVTHRFALLVEDEVTSVLDDTQYHQAVKLLNDSTSQIICIIGYRFSLKDFPHARVYECYMDTEDIAHIELIR